MREKKRRKKRIQLETEKEEWERRRENSQRQRVRLSKEEEKRKSLREWKATKERENNIILLIHTCYSMYKYPYLEHPKYPYLEHPIILCINVQNGKSN